METEETTNSVVAATIPMDEGNKKGHFQVISSLDDYYSKIYGKQDNVEEAMKEEFDREIEMEESRQRSPNNLNPEENSTKDPTKGDPEQTKGDISKIENVNTDAIMKKLEDKTLHRKSVKEIKQNYFESLPDETLFRIWSFLDAVSIGKAAQVCRR